MERIRKAGTRRGSQTREKEKEKEKKITVTGGLRGNKTSPKTEAKKEKKTGCQRGAKERTVFPCSKCFLLSPSVVCSGGNCPAEPNSFSVGSEPGEDRIRADHRGLQHRTDTEVIVFLSVFYSSSAPFSHHSFSRREHEIHSFHSGRCEAQHCNYRVCSGCSLHFQLVVVLQSICLSNSLIHDLVPDLSIKSSMANQPVSTL